MRTKRICLIVLLVVIASFAVWMAMRQAIIGVSEHRAKTVIRTVLPQEPASDDETIRALTTYIFQNFQHAHTGQVPSLHKLRPFVTNHRLPSWLKLPDGLIESYTMRGHCDDAARTLSFILKQNGYTSKQWDMILPDRSHSALQITLPDNRAILADPFYGVVAQAADGSLTGAEQAQAAIRNGAKFDDVFLRLGPESDPQFYQEFGKASMAAKDETLVLESTLPALNRKPLAFGTINGDDQDVRSAGVANGLNPYWYYIGHKYNRGWVRVLRAEEPVRIEMTLIDPPESGILNASPAPAIDGKTLTWSLKSGESITLKDGAARLSLKRLNSYIGIDRIVISPDYP